MFYSDSTPAPQNRKRELREAAFWTEYREDVTYEMLTTTPDATTTKQRMDRFHYSSQWRPGVTEGSAARSHAPSPSGSRLLHRVRPQHLDPLRPPVLLVCELESASACWT